MKLPVERTTKTFLLNTKLNPYNCLVDYLSRSSYNKNDNTFSDIVIHTLPNAKIIEIDNTLLPLIESTENSVFYRPLFFDNIFINSDIYVAGDYYIKGMGILDGLQHPINMKDWLMYCLICKNNENGGLLYFNSLVDK